MLLAEAVFFGKRATKRVIASIVIVCLGVGLSTVTDTQARYLCICAGAGTFHRGNMGFCRPVQRMVMPVQAAGVIFVAPAQTAAVHRPNLSRDVAEAAM